MPGSVENIIKINTESSIFLSRISDSFGGQKFDPLFIQFYSLNIIRRIVFYQRALIPLVSEFSKNANYEFPIAVLLRSACLDVLQYGYIIKALDEVVINEKNPRPDIIPDYKVLKERLISVYNGNLINQIEDWKALNKVKEITDQEFKMLKEKIYEEFSPYFPDNLNTKQNSMSARRLFKELRNNEKYELFSDVFYYYSYYSKLEHFGILSYSYAKPDNFDLNESVKKIKHITYTFLKVTQRGLLFLERPNSEIEKLGNWIDELLK